MRVALFFFTGNEQFTELQYNQEFLVFYFLCLNLPLIHQQ